MTTQYLSCVKNGSPQILDYSLYLFAKGLLGTGTLDTSVSVLLSNVRLHPRLTSSSILLLVFEYFFRLLRQSQPTGRSHHFDVPEYLPLSNSHPVGTGSTRSPRSSRSYRHVPFLPTPTGSVCRGRRTIYAAVKRREDECQSHSLLSPPSLTCRRWFLTRLSCRIFRLSPFSFSPSLRLNHPFLLFLLTNYSFCK